MADEYPDPDEEFELMHAEEMEMLNEMNNVDYAAYDGPKAKRSLDFNSPKVSNRTSQNYSPEAEVLQNSSFTLPNESEVSTGTANHVTSQAVNNSQDPVNTENILQALNEFPENSNKRRVEDLFGDIDDIFFDDEPFAKKSKHDGLTEDERQLLTIETIIQERKIFQEAKILPRVTNSNKRSIRSNKVVLSRTVPRWNFMPLTDKKGERIYARLHSEEEFEKQLSDMSNQNFKGGLLSVPFEQLQKLAHEQLQLKWDRIEKKEAEKKANANEVEVIYDPEETLWVEKYKPTSYLELLSDESTNRALLQWLKLWDKVVFNIERKVKIKPKEEPKFKGGRFKKNTGPVVTVELDEHGRPYHKIALLCGPPGLGKTTLAHLIAHQAGYNVVEVNASDDRSPETFRTQLEAATQMKAVMGAERRPNCLVLDEIDGAPAFRTQLEAATQMKAVMGAERRPNCLVLDEIDGAPAFRTQLEAATQMKAVMGAERRPNCLVLDEIDGAPAFRTQLEAATQMKAVMGAERRPNCLVLDEIDGAPAFRTQLEAATQMKAVMGAERRPNCLVLDEIDGAPAASIDVLLKFALGKTTGRRKGLKVKKMYTGEEKSGILRRPIICICNDVYVPALRPLRQAAFVVHFPPTATARLAQRLCEVARDQSIKADLGVMMALSEKTNNDIRSCLALLQCLKKQSATVVKLSQVHAASLGQKDMQKGLFTVWQEIFQIPRPKRKTFVDTVNRESNLLTKPDLDTCESKMNTSTLTERTRSVLRTVQGCGDYERLAQGVFENYLNMKIKDSSMISIANGLSWFCHFDLISSRIHITQNYILYPYLAYPFVIWHLLFANFSWPKLIYPSSSFEMVTKLQRTIQIVDEVLKSMTPKVRAYTYREQLVLDTLPLILEVIVPNLRPVSLTLYSSKEKEELQHVISVMIDYNLTYTQERIQDGNFVFNLDPNVEEVCRVDGGKGFRVLSYAGRQLVSREIELERLRRAEANLYRDAEPVASQPTASPFTSKVVKTATTPKGSS